MACVQTAIRKEEIFLNLTLPRSQAIYGSLVETFGPYSQHYTMRMLFILSIWILTG